MKAFETSHTAYIVSQALLQIAADPRYAGLVAADQAVACRTMLQATDEGRRLLRQLDSRLYLRVYPLVERLLIPGIAFHHALRKRFFEQACRTAIAEGYDQVINIGAGLDTLAWRLHRHYPEVTFVELDHPAGSHTKQQAISARGPNFHLAAVDLTQTPIGEALGAIPTFDPARRTFYLCEGVLPYLSEAVVIELFQALRRLTDARGRLAFTVTTPHQANLGLRLYLRLKGEPFKWSLERAGLAQFVAEHGFRLLETADDADLVKRFSVPAPAILHRNEYLGLAEAN